MAPFIYGKNSKKVKKTTPNEKRKLNDHRLSMAVRNRLKQTE